MRMKRIYVAGAYSADNVISVLNNMRRGIRLATKVLLNGYAPFAPWLDYQFQFILRDDEILTLDDYYNYSLAWLEVADAVLVVPGSENSKGTQAEITKAKELKIPVYYSLKELRDGEAKRV